MMNKINIEHDITRVLPAYYIFNIIIIDHYITGVCYAQQDNY